MCARKSGRRILQIYLYTFKIQIRTYSIFPFHLFCSIFLKCDSKQLT
jgi:hypothetical protein